MEIQKLSRKYTVRKLNDTDIDNIYEIMQGNPQYFQYCPPMATVQSIAEENYQYIRLGFAKGNPQSEAFWIKNGFERTGVEDVQERYTVVVMERQI